MANPQSGVKSKIAIGTTAAATDLTTFQADTYTTIGKLGELGAISQVAEEIKFTDISDAYVHKAQGVKDGGTFDLVVAFDKTDAGQIALKAADVSGAATNFRITLGDNETQFFFKGIVLGGEYNAASANDVVKVTWKISITSPVIIGDAE